eukprot:gb/GFBE01015825.1/.p1 GENE.gb/GFBE01015825.1/~~gb/GFBE01015825.1/.p1  ORF type:complete len:400 (+),score=112.77 gb/GFBE01015825.1/:1-1200(+)
MVRVACVAAIIASASGINLNLREGTQAQQSQEFTAFIKKYGRSYEPGTAEYKLRLAHYSTAAARAADFNAREGMLWKAGAGPFADYSPAELEAMRGWHGAASPTLGHGQRGTSLLQDDDDDLPEQVDAWSHLDALFARDQGSCGSCWAISASTVLSAHAEIYNSSQTSFSTQELVDCVPNPRKCGGTGGCSGATVELAMNYAIKNGLVTPREDLYMAADQTCKHKDKLMLHQAEGKKDEDFTQAIVHQALPNDVGPQFGMHGWQRLPENKYKPLLRAVYEHGPVAVSVDASDWQLYESGIFDSCNKDAVINHAVTLIGYGKDAKLNNEKYWLIQNSWGEYYGENGRIRLLRRDTDETKQCGIDKQPQDGTGCEGGPAQVKVCGMCGVLYDSVVPHFKKA